jgi:acid phosphatase (class A)
MSPRLRRLSGALAVLLALSAAWTWWRQQHPAHHYVSSPPADFAATFAPPSAADSAATRAELDELLAIQAARTPAQVAAARGDRKTRIDRFYPALGIDPEHAPALPRLHGIAERVEDDVRLYVRAAKDRFRRLRPYEIEPRLKPCIDNVAGDLSYPSGHAAFAWSMAYLLSDLVPERRDVLLARAAEFARQRVVCGVHFPSDLEAGKRAAGWLLEQMRRNPDFITDRDRAAQELRAVLGLPPGIPRSLPQAAGHSSVSRAPPRLALEPATTRPR